MTKMFYENLYKKKRGFENENICLKLTILNIRKLTRDEKESIEGPILKNEALSFVKKIGKRIKALVLVVLQLSFLNIFLFDLIYFVTRSIDISYKLGEYVYYKSEIISCIPTQDKPKYVFFLNWRSITLLTVV